MSTELISAVQSIAIDAIKILGPATIAAYATYRASKFQFEARLVELKEENEFAARSVLFDCYKDRHRQLRKAHAKLGKSLGENVGLIAGLSGGGQDRDYEHFVRLFGESLQTYFEIAPVEIAITLRDMERKELTDTEEFHSLKKYEQIDQHIGDEDIYEGVKSNCLTYLKIYEFLQMANQLVLTHEMDRVFEKYTKQV